MAAFTGTPVSTTHYSNQLATNRDNLAVNDPQRLIIKRFPRYTHAAGAGTGTVNLGLLPSGPISIYPTLSAVVTSAFATSADIHIGYLAYTDNDGASVNADDNAFLDNADAATGGSFPLNLPAAGYLEVNTRDGLVISAMIDAGDIEDGDTIDCWIAYTQG